MKASRKILLSLLVAIISVAVCFGLAACNFGALNNKLSNENGFIVEGGNFAEGAVLEASLVESTDADYEQAMTVIANSGESYDNTKPVYVFEISVKKDGVKVQPNGKVKVSVPVSADLTDYAVLHIKDNGTVERLSITYKSGIATFETESFSKFVFVKKVSSSPIGGGENTVTKYMFKASVQEYTGVADIGTISENNAVVNLTEGIEVASGTKITLTATAKEGYALKGWYKVEGTSEALISCATTCEFTVNENMNIKAVFDEKVIVSVNGFGPALDSRYNGNILIKAKGVELVGSYSGNIFAKGTEISIDVIPADGFEFRCLSWSYMSDYNNEHVVNTAQYTFTATEDISFYASFYGIPKKLVFSQSTKIAMENYRGYKINSDGCFEKTVTVGASLEDYKTDVRLWLYYADKNDTWIECYYDNGLDNQFTVDDSALNINEVGRYEIIYTYIGWHAEGQAPVTLSIFINVVADTSA